MVQLVLHTEYLLCNHECVLVPGLGGFLSHIMPAHYDETTSTWYPPQRQITFNPGLFYNDGLLVSSYAEAYSVSIEDSFILVEKAVSELKKELKNNQSISFGKIGGFSYNDNGQIFFTPATNFQHFLPVTYGLQPISILPLKKIKETIITYEDQNSDEQRNRTEKRIIRKRTDTIYIPLRKKVIYQCLAIASIVLFFMLFSTPINVDNTHKTNYAKLLTPMIQGNSDFDNIFLSEKTLEKSSEQTEEMTNNALKETEKVVLPKPESQKNQITEDISATKEEKRVVPQPSNKPKEEKIATNVAPKNVEKTTAKSDNNVLSPQTGYYYVIIGSFPKQADAQAYANYAKGNGVKNVGVIISQGSKLNRYRVYAGKFGVKQEAYQKMASVTSTYKEHPDAWIHHEK